MITRSIFLFCCSFKEWIEGKYGELIIKNLRYVPVDKVKMTDSAIIWHCCFASAQARRVYLISFTFNNSVTQSLGTDPQCLPSCFNWWMPLTIHLNRCWIHQTKSNLVWLTGAFGQTLSIIVQHFSLSIIWDPNTNLVGLWLTYTWGKNWVKLNGTKNKKIHLETFSKLIWSCSPN